jgi:hypothetical protein
MQLSTHFGKFRLKFIASINLAALLSIFNIASSVSPYWIKYIDNFSGSTHFAGMLRSCPNEGGCEWRNGIVNHTHTTWSVFTRVLIALGTVCNIVVLAIFVSAFIFKLKKMSKLTIPTMEIGNFTLIVSFVCLFIGFTIFISSTCNFSLWLFVLSMVILVCTCNLLTRTFAAVYFQNYRFKGSKSIETGISHSKLASEPEEVVALTKESVDEARTEIEMDKIKSGSSEVLIIAAGQVEGPVAAEGSVDKVEEVKEA